MNRRLMYADEKFGLAVEVLATGRDPLRERFLAAWACFCTIGPEDMPSRGSKALFEAMVTRATWCEGPDGTLPATLAVVSDREVQELARMVVGLHFDLQAALLADARKWPRR